MLEKMNVNIEDGFVNRGNLYRIHKVMDAAKKGENVKIAFIGGSITQGCLATVHEKCYSYLTYKWWCDKYGEENTEYINAGIGGTTSQYGVARVEEDVLSKNPSIVFIEFSVNDECNAFFEETYESLIRRVYGHESKPAVILIHNIKYDDGWTAIDIHLKLGKHYELPCISVIPVTYASMKKGEITSLDITEDNLHPNDVGHKIISEIITSALQRMMDDVAENELELSMPNLVTRSAYEKSICVRNNADESIAKIQLEGFEKDTAKKEYYTDIFKGGWIGKNVGDKIKFSVTGTGIAVQYRKTINKPAPIAKITIDNDEANGVILDGNFDETWGDELHLDTILMHGNEKEYNVTIEIIEANNIKTPFYLNAIIVS